MALRAAAFPSPALPYFWFSFCPACPRAEGSRRTSRVSTPVLPRSLLQPPCSPRVPPPTPGSFLMLLPSAKDFSFFFFFAKKSTFILSVPSPVPFSKGLIQLLTPMKLSTKPFGWTCPHFRTPWHSLVPLFGFSYPSLYYSFHVHLMALNTLSVSQEKFQRLVSPSLSCRLAQGLPAR